jgi:glycosyltransferase involved in cell wall biosynthesis
MTRAPLRVVLYEPSGHGGICHYTYQLAQSLTGHGARVTVVTTASYELAHLPRSFRLEFLFKPSRLKVLVDRRIRSLTRRPGRRRSNDAAAGRRTLDRLRLIRDRFRKLMAVLRFLLQRPDVIHFQSVNRWEDRRFLRLLSRLGFPVLYTAHDLLPHGSDLPSDHRALQAIYQTADQIIVHAEQNKRELVGLFEVEPRRVQVIPHGSYDFLFARGRPSKEEARRRFGIPSGRRVVLFFGIIKRYKGLEYLVQAFETVREHLHDAMLVVVGSIYNGDADSFDEYSRLIDGLRGRDDVLCVPEYVPVEDVGDYLRAADLVVLPYTKTYHSGVLLSAYAAARPVVVTDTGGLAEVVEDGKSGFVVSPRDAAALAGAILRALDPPGRAEAMGVQAGRLAVTTYSWDAIATRTIDLYRKVVQERSQHRGVFAKRVRAVSSPPKRKAAASTPPPK